MKLLWLTSGLAALLRPQAVDGVGEGGADGLEDGGGEGDKKDESGGNGEEPGVDGGAVGEVLEPLAHGEPGEGRGDEDGKSDEPKEVF